jgi:myo-inositol-1(or 4)-monophosphatase
MSYGMNRSDSIDLRLSVAIEAARAVGTTVKARRVIGSGIVVRKKGPQDYVTTTDEEAECEIRKRISCTFPSDTVVGEEMGGTVSGATWFIDPIDGTTNFIREGTHYAISIGFALDGRPCIGVVYDPESDLLFSARLGAGAYCNGTPIVAASTDDLSTACVEVGCWRRSPPPSNYTNVVLQMLSLGLEFRWKGCAALALADVARGRSDGFSALHLNSWDAVAGIVLVNEAGGRTTDFLSGNGLQSGNALLACAPKLFDGLLWATKGIV